MARALETSTAPAVQAWSTDDISVLTLTAQGAGTVLSSDQLNPAGSGIKLVIDITAITGTSPTLTVTLQGKDTTSGKYFTILASAALNATGTTVLTVFPSAPVAANVSANDLLPRSWRVSAVVGGTGPSVTATIGASVVRT